MKLATPCCFIATTLAASAAAAQDLQPGANFVSAPSKVAQSTTNAESSHLGDFDLDGDLDALVTQGGTFSKLQTRLWRSDASTAGGNFVFTDITNTNFPVLASSAQHVTAADIDLDGDLDLLLSNTTQFFAQSNVWLVNQGGAQGGTAGVFLMDFTRWTGLGGAGSSIPASLVINSGTFAGGFADWSQYCDFADVDLDGDYDYLQTSVGPSFGGATMSRMFLNNGAGNFSEYNPSGAVSGTSALASGSAAGWAEGTQLTNSTASDGSTHDITNVTWSADFADIDNDFDLDLLVNNRTGQSRMYTNRFVENGFSPGSEGAGTRLFRDTTATSLLLAQTGGVCTDFTFGDIDLDDDVDIWAVSYSSFADEILINNGSGAFSGIGSPLGDPGADENEVEFLDYDADGDLDAITANFEGVNSIYKNLAAQGASTAAASSFLARTSVLGTETEIATPGTVADSWLSVSAADLDNDNDTDLFFTQDGSSTSSAIHINSLGVAESTAPRIPRITLHGGATPPTSTPRRVVAQVYDNNPTGRSRDAVANIKFKINGGAAMSASARWSGGNLFRGAIPGYWFGNIEYWMEVTDEAGNTGSSAHNFITIPVAGLSNYGAATAGCSGVQHTTANSGATIGNSEFVISTTNCPASTLNLLLTASGSTTGVDYGFGILLHVDLFAAEVAAIDMPSDALGTGYAPIPIPNNPLLVNSIYYAQTISYWSGPCTPSPLGLSVSDALAITILQ